MIARSGSRFSALPSLDRSRGFSAAALAGAAFAGDFLAGRALGAGLAGLLRGGHLDQVGGGVGAFIAAPRVLGWAVPYFYPPSYGRQQNNSIVSLTVSDEFELPWRRLSLRFRAAAVGSLAVFLLGEPGVQLSKMLHGFRAGLPVPRAVQQFPITTFASAYQFDKARDGVLDPVPTHRALRVVCIDDLGSCT